MVKKKHSEQRARQVARELLIFRGWNVNPINKNGQSLEENEYRNHKSLRPIFKGKSKTGKGDGYPDFLLVKTPQSLLPLLIIETKPTLAESQQAINEACHYGDACIDKGHNVICVGIAGGEKELCNVIVKKKIDNEWLELILNDIPIDWIPSPEQTQAILEDKKRVNVEPERPNEIVLANQANKLNEILRECKIKDEYRPVYVATFMLALWKGDVSIDPDVVLKQVNANAEKALIQAGKPELCHSLRVDDENDSLASKSWVIIDILKKLNIRSFLQEHDYLGQLYETFFRYTGGNTIGQYFTPRHIIALICDIVGVNKGDTILDPACGTGGFLIGGLNRIIKKENLPYEEIVKSVKNNLYGIESEPATAALCIANMILRGDGKSGVVKADCFSLTEYPSKEVDFVLMNPPFPHKKTDTPATDFIDRGLSGLKKRGILASIIPYSLLVKTKDWHKTILKKNSLLFIATLPPDLFNPYSSFNTAILVIQKGLAHKDKKVFVCKITNDGYKLKKKNRVPQNGSQLETILNSYDSKQDIPEVCKYSLIDSNSKEWSPEAFIDDAPHSDKSFLLGLEESMRKQASFYVHSGYRLIPNSKIKNVKNVTLNPGFYSDNSKISLKGIKLQLFKVSDYFNVELGGKDEVEDLVDGPYPVVTTSEFFNGVSSWKTPNNFYDYPSITVATDGSTCSSFVQEFPYYCFYKVAVLKPKDKRISKDALYFIAHLLFRQKWRYVYARKFGKERILNTILYAPSIKGKPDFLTMAKLIRKTRWYPLIRQFRDIIKENNKK